MAGRGKGEPVSGMTTTSEVPRVVVVGSVMVDLVTYADPLPDSGQTVTGSAFEIGCGGKGANQALIAHRLGADVTFVARVGPDIFGDMSLANLSALGIDPASVKRVAGSATGVAPIWVTSDGSNRIIIVPGANQAMSAEVVRTELADLARADSMVCQLEIPNDAVAEALVMGAAMGAVTILNPAPARRNSIAMFGAADWVVPNEHEFEMLWGASPTDDEILAAAAQWGCGLVVTLGAAGAAATNGADVIRLEPPPAKVVDTTGAGDAFVGGLAFALATGLSLHSAIELGNTCGALSTEVRGTQSSFPSRQKVELHGRTGITGQATSRWVAPEP